MISRNRTKTHCFVDALQQPTCEVWYLLKLP